MEGSQVNVDVFGWLSPLNRATSPRSSTILPMMQGSQKLSVLVVNRVPCLLARRADQGCLGTTQARVSRGATGYNGREFGADPEVGSGNGVSLTTPTVPTPSPTRYRP